MNIIQKFSLTLLRVVLGGFFFYSGLKHILDPNWSAANYLQSAGTLSGFYHWLASPGILPIINSINAWGMALLGVSLILGLFIRYSTPLGITLMILYYIPISNFPYPNPRAFIIDDHIIFASALFVLFSFDAGKFFGLDLFRKILFKKR